jgi:hypothetical protein
MDHDTEQKALLLRLRTEFVQAQQAEGGLNADVGLDVFRAWLVERLGEADADYILRRFPIEAAGGVRWISS